MSVFVVGILETPVFRTAVERAPGMDVVIDRQMMTPDGDIDMTMHVRGGDLDAFESGLEADPTVERGTRIGGDGTRSLYRARLSEEGESLATYNSWASEDAVFVSSERARDGWRVTLRFRDRDGLQRYGSFCEANGISFDPRQIRDEDGDWSGSRFGLTDLQKRSLMLAKQQGFYDIPRESTLEDLAASADVSHQALSERLRRGVGSLIEHTVGVGRTTDACRTTVDGTRPFDIGGSPTL